MLSTASCPQNRRRSSTKTAVFLSLVERKSRQKKERIWIRQKKKRRPLPTARKAAFHFAYHDRSIHPAWPLCGIAQHRKLTRNECCGRRKSSLLCHAFSQCLGADLQAFAILALLCKSVNRHPQRSFHARHCNGNGKGKQCCTFQRTLSSIFLRCSITAMPTFRHCGMRLAVPVGKMKRRFPRRRRRTAFPLLPYPDSLFFLPTFSLY